MKIVHKINNLKLEKKIGNNYENNPVTILSNNIGGFLFLSEPPITKYNGFFFNDNLQLFKTLESIHLKNSKIIEIQNHFTHISRIYESGNTDNLECFKGVNGFIYSLAKKDEVHLSFDCRKSNDLRSFGQYYNFYFEDNKIILEFTKRTDQKEDMNSGEEEFKLFTAIYADDFKKTDLTKRDCWKEHVYKYDSFREDFPVERHVYRPFSLNAKKILLGFGRTKEEALSEINKLLKIKHNSHDVVPLNGDEKFNIAFMCAQDSLDKLIVDYNGIPRLYAGFPWFYQFWTRDECISLGGLIKLGKLDLVKKNLLNYLDNFLDDGRLPNHIPNAHIGSADGVGWFWKRLSDLIESVEKLGTIHDFFTKNEINKIKEKLLFSLERITNNFGNNGLISNNFQETWMDTAVESKGKREGIHIEIQTLHLNMLKLAYKLTNSIIYKNKEELMRNKVREKFWTGKILKDGINNLTIRPNIFLAYYVYPEILSNEEWVLCFKNSLPSLWCDWGGLTSIDKKDSRFVDHYTGRNDDSYHHGDSWFFINNFAALCMYRVDKIKFQDYIAKIINSSTEELLWNGVIGHSAEVSGADKLASYGCLSQAWSVGTYIELMLELQKST